MPFSISSRTTTWAPRSRGSAFTASSVWRGSAGAAALAAPDSCARPPRERPRPWRLIVNKRVSAAADALSLYSARRGVGHTASRLRSRAALDRPGRPTPTAIGPRPARPLDGAPGRRTRATVATSTHARGQRGVRRASCRRLPWYRQPRDRSSAAPRRSPIPSSASVVLSARAMPKRRARSRVARRTCIICKITHETHGTCSKHRLQNAAVASTQKPQAVPSRSRSLLRRPNCLRIRTTPVSAWRTPFGRARSGSACAATTR